MHLEPDDRLVGRHAAPPRAAVSTGCRVCQDVALLVRVRGAQQRRLVERRPDELQADRQPGRREAARHRDAREAREVDRQREDVVQVHRERIFLLAELERDAGVVGAAMSVDLRERLLEVAPISVRTFCALP